MICPTCGASPCRNPSFCAECREQEGAAPHEFTYEYAPDDAREQAEHKHNGQTSGDKQREQQEPPGEQEPIMRSYVARPAHLLHRREWLHAKHYVRGYVVATVAPTEYGKTSLALVNAIEMVLNIGLIGPPPVAGRQLRVGYWNAEDPPEETERRIAAICLKYEIDPKRLESWLFIGRKFKRVISADPKSPRRRRRLAEFNPKTGLLELNVEVLAEIDQFIRETKLDVLQLDPLVAFHSIPENNNNSMEELIKDVLTPTLVEEHNICLELLMHTRKIAGGVKPAEITADDARGASAQMAAMRSTRVLNRMSREDAKIPGISPERCILYLRVSRQGNLMPPPERATWIHLFSQDLPNGNDGKPGDNVQVVTAWSYPDPLGNTTAEDLHWARDYCREHQPPAAPQSSDWFGFALMDHLKLDRALTGSRKVASNVLKGWRTSGALKTIETKGKNRHKGKRYAPGDWNEKKQPAAT